MKYKRCTKSELQRFVTNRGIRVPPSLPPIYRRGKRVTFKRDYIAALKKADTLTTFHFFLDLPPGTSASYCSYGNPLTNPRRQR
jgi:hypothetical protein